MEVTFESIGNFEATTKFLEKASRMEALRVLNAYGEKGVRALEAATPVDSGATASSWSFEVTGTRGNYIISWNNSHVNQGVNIALILQLGHGTGTGGYVQGRDYINPAIRPIFDQMAEDVWREVTS